MKLLTTDKPLGCLEVWSPHPPLCQSFALVVSGRLQVSLQALLLRLQLFGVVGLKASARADVLQLLQQLLLFVDEDEAVALRVQQPRPGLAVQFGDLHLDGGDPAGAKGRGERARDGERQRWKRKRKQSGEQMMIHPRCLHLSLASSAYSGANNRTPKTLRHFETQKYIDNRQKGK